MTTHRFGAVVNVNQTPEEVADKLGVPLSRLVDYGNGYAVIKSKTKRTRKPVEAPESDTEAPTVDEEASEDS